MMSSAATTSIGRHAETPPLLDARLPESVWYAPLVPAALALTAGILLDRYAAPPLPASLIAVVACILAWFCTRNSSSRGLPLVYLALAGIAFGCAYHHYRSDTLSPDDISYAVKDEPMPVQVRGILDAEPERTPPQAADPLRSIPYAGSTATILRVRELRRGDNWLSVSGRVRAIGTANWPELHCGDAVEIVGQLERIAPPGNPGEPDFAETWRDRGIRVALIARKSPHAVVRLERGWPMSVNGWLAVMRGHGQRMLRDALPERYGGLAGALLLGEGSSMTRADWDKYIRTGVIHVLAISGQHLVILAGFLWFALPRLGVRQRHAAGIVAIILFGYALVTGARPPALRSAVAVCAACGGLMLRRRVLPVNLFALAWITVALVDPSDLFTSGCLLSFLGVAGLYWIARRLFQREEDPLAQLIEENRPAWQRGLRRLGRFVIECYIANALIWLLITPLAAARYQMISPISIVLGPPLVLLTTIALFAGFLLLFVGMVCPPLTVAIAPVVRFSLAGCEWLVEGGDRLPFAYFHIGEVADWWLWIFYAGLFAAMTQGPLLRRWRWAIIAGCGWLCVGLAAGAARLPADELRCTFLAVGHGGCTVLEMPDGRVLLYDAGSLRGPDVARRQIAPFLHYRGIHRIDEVILSHADLDHFNGLPDLLDRFTIGQVTCTPSFADKPTPGVRHTLNELSRRAIPMRIVKAGDRLTAGDVVLRVLHPPAVGPAGNENARSLVLEVQHAGHTILLTGDLEGAGMRRMLDEVPPHRVEVLMAPHHGSHLVNTPELAQWARPRVVVSCQGRPRPSPDVRECYRLIGAQLFETGEHGAVTVRSHASGLVIETFLSRQRFVVRNRDR